MENLTKFVLLSIAMNNLSLKVVTMIEEHFSNAYSAVLFYYDDQTFWYEIHLKIPNIRTSKPHHIRLGQAFDGYILDFRQEHWTTDELLALRRSHKTKQLIFVTNKTEQDVMKVIEHTGFCHCIVVSVPEWTVWRKHDPCHGIGATPKPADNCTATMSFMDYPPRMIRSGDKILGMDGIMVQTVADHLGIKLNFINRHESNFGHVHPPSGLEGDVDTGVSLVGAGNLYPFVARYEAFDWVTGCAPTTLTWAVPTAAGSLGGSSLEEVLNELSPAVWLASLTTYLVFIAITFITSKSFMALSILGLILGIPQEQPPSRFLTGLVLCFGIVVTSFYKTVMSSKVTAPSPVPEIHTLQDLANSKLKLIGGSSTREIWRDITNAYPEHVAKRKINASIIVDDDVKLDDLFLRMVEKRDVAYLRHAVNMLYIVQKDPRTRNKIHIVEESALTFIPRTVMRKHSCLSGSFQKAFTNLCEAGLGQKWINDYFPKLAKLETELHPMNLDHIRGAIDLLAIGLGLSALLFLLELLVSKSKKRLKLINEARIFAKRRVRTEIDKKGKKMRIKLGFDHSDNAKESIKKRRFMH